MKKENYQFFTFVIMPFKNEFNDIYQLGIKETSQKCGVKAERLDEQLFNEGMLDRIYKQIETADFIIADLSERNPNVFYELGFAHSKDKICILLTKSSTDIPFDLKHKRHIVYGDSISHLKKELEKNIEWAKNEVLNKRQSKISIVNKQPTGILTTTDQFAEVTITFTFDLHNKTEKVSSDISAIYLYTGKKWDVKIDGKTCPSSDADITPYKYRYFITPPSQKLGKNGWTQIQIKATRIIAEVWNGDIIENAYSIGGVGVLRIETTEENIDYEFNFNIIVEEFPF